MTVKPAGSLTVGHYYNLDMFVFKSETAVIVQTPYSPSSALCVQTDILCCRNTTTKAVLCMTKVKNLGPYGLKGMVNMSPNHLSKPKNSTYFSPYTFFFPELSINLFCFHLSLYLALCLCSFHDQESSKLLWTRLNPSAHQNACSDYLFHS